MATAAIISGFTKLSSCDATTGWSGANTVDVEFKKEGTASLSGTLRTAGLNIREFTWSGNLSNTHLRLWFSFAAPGLLATSVNGGIRLHVVTTTGTGYWYLGGSDTYDGGWTLLTVDTSKAFDSGTGSLSSVTAIGFTISLLTTPRNAINTWWDNLTYGNGYQITGGTSADPVTMESIYQADLLTGWGLIQKKASVYFLNSALTIGSISTATNTYFQDTDQVIIFENLSINDTLYTFKAAGSATNSTTFNLYNSVIKSASILKRFNLSLDDVNLDALAFEGNSITNCNLTNFKAGQTIKNTVWQNTNQVIPLTATITGSTFARSVGTEGALKLISTHNLTSSKFISNQKAIFINTAGTYSLSDVQFDLNTIDINNTSGGSVVINATNGANPITYSGTVSIQNLAYLTLTGLKTGTEIRIYRTSDDTLLGGVEDSGTSYIYEYNTTGEVPVYLRIHNLNYIPITLNLTLGTDQTLPIQQVLDRQYVNP